MRQTHYLSYLLIGISLLRTEICSAIQYNQHDFAYTGLDISLIQLKARKDWQSHFPKSYSNLNVFVGLRSDKNFGIEFSWSVLKKREKTFSYRAGDQFFDRQFTQNGQGKSIVRLKHAGLDLIKYQSLNSKCELIYSLGLGYIKPKIDYRTLSNEFNLSSKLRMSSHVSVRAGLSLQTMLTQWVGLRTRWHFESSTNLKLQQNPYLFGFSRHLYKNMQSVSCGTFVKF